MKAGWKRKRLAEVCTLQRGFDLPTKDRKFGNVPLVSSSGVVDHIDRSKVEGPGVVTGRSGSIGNVFFVKDDFWPLNTALYVKDFFGNDERFVFLLLKSLDLVRFASGTGVPTLNRNHVSDEIVFVPECVLEQRRIVAVLDEAFAAIATATANAEKNLANARELYERILQEVFIAKGRDWIEEPLNANVRFIDYRGKTPPKRESGVRLITAKNVKMGHIQRSPEEFIDAAAYDGWMTRGFPSKGDVLFTTEAPLGNVAQLDTDEKVVIGQRLITLQPKARSVDRTFLKYMLCSAPLQDLILKQATGATVSGIKASLLKLIPISYPPQIEAQHEIVKRLDTAYAHSNSLALHYRARIEELSALKESLLRTAFSGAFVLPVTKSLAA